MCTQRESPFPSNQSLIGLWCLSLCSSRGRCNMYMEMYSLCFFCSNSIVLGLLSALNPIFLPLRSSIRWNRRFTLTFLKSEILFSKFNTRVLTESWEAERSSDWAWLSWVCHVTDYIVLIGSAEEWARFFYDMSKASPTRKMILIGCFMCTRWCSIT